MSRSNSKPSAEGRAGASFVLLGVFCLLCMLAALAPALEAQADQTVALDLFLDGEPVGTVDATVSGDAVSLVRARIVEVLGPVVDEQTLDLLRQGGTPPGGPRVGLSELSEIGLEAVFDARRLQVRISVPTDKRKPRTLDIQGSAVPPAAVVETPADFSGALNLRVRADVPMSAAGAFPLSLSVEPAMNAFGVALEADLSTDILPSWQASLEMARVVKDLPGSSLRLVAGSLFLPVTGFMQQQSLAGIEAVHNARLFHAGGPDQTVRQEIAIDGTSTVDVSLNGRLLRSFALDPGRYSLLDIPFVSGINELLVGEERRIVPWDSRLLPAGESSWTASVGIPQWQLSLPIASGFLLHGFSPFVTAGVHLQAGADRQIAGVEGLFATPAGNLHAVAAIGTGGPSPDFGGLLEYRLAFPGAAMLPVVGLAAQYTGRGFVGPGSTQDASIYSWQLSAAVSQALPLGFGVSIGLGWRGAWTAGSDAAGLNLTITRPIGQGTSVAFIFSAQFPQGAPAQFQGTFSLVSSGQEQRRSIDMSTSMADSTASVDVRLQPGSDPAAPVLFGTFGGLPGTTGELSGTVGAQFSWPFLDATLSDSFSAASNTLSVDAGLALVTAGGAFGISRPVSDSFAIIVPRENMNDQRVVVNMGAGLAAAVAENGRTAVLSGLSAYAPTAVTVEAPDAPAGIDVGSFLLTLQPSYRSGIAVPVGEKATVYAQGRLLTSEGTPAVFQAGKAVLLDDPEAAPLPFFTDENGVFQIYGLMPGNYELVLEDGGASRPALSATRNSASFMVPAEAAGFFDAGDLRLPARDPQKGQ